jgi:hypothetical protein
MRRVSALVCSVLLGLLGIAVAEASLAALVLLFSYMLKLRLAIELGAAHVLGGQADGYQPQVLLLNGGTTVSILFTAGCGLVVAAWKFRRWRPA